MKGALKRLTQARCAALAFVALASAATAPAHAYGNAERFVDKTKVCSLAADIAELNWRMVKKGDGGYTIPANATGSYRRLLEGSLNAGVPESNATAYDAHWAGWGYCIDSIEYSLTQSD